MTHYYEEREIQDVVAEFKKPKTFKQTSDLVRMEKKLKIAMSDAGFNLKKVKENKQTFKIQEV